MTPQNPFEAMLPAQEMAQEWPKAMNPALAQFNPQGDDKRCGRPCRRDAGGVLGKQFNPEGLDAKTRLLLTLQGLTIQGAQAEAQIRLTVRHALEAGATKQEIAETIGMMRCSAACPR
jgi:4-carboxymuconolactone decarboxylase